MKLKDFFIRESIVIWVIVINAISLFFGAFPDTNYIALKVLYWIDYSCTLYFVIEMVLKISTFGRRIYWASGWNRFDFFVVVVSMPSLLDPVISMKAFSAVLVLRLARLTRFFKVLRVVPDAERIGVGIIRALKASVGILLALLILNLMLSMGATMLFGKIAPEYFGDPIISIYSLFKVFTVEGWYEIPDLIASRTHSSLMIFAIRAYFVTSVLIGGILGLSLANAIFVNEMIMDDTNRIENVLSEIKGEIEKLKNAIEDRGGE